MEAVCNGGGGVSSSKLAFLKLPDHTHNTHLPNGFTSFQVTEKKLSMGATNNSQPKIVTGEAGYVLEDVPHLSDYIPDLPVIMLLPHPFSINLIR